MRVRTKDEIETLKADWLEDDCWNLEDTEGFERRTPPTGGESSGTRLLGSLVGHHRESGESNQSTGAESRKGRRLLIGPNYFSILTMMKFRDLDSHVQRLRSQNGLQGRAEHFTNIY